MSQFGVFLEVAVRQWCGLEQLGAGSSSHLGASLFMQSWVFPSEIYMWSSLGFLTAWWPKGSWTAYVVAKELGSIPVLNCKISLFLSLCNGVASGMVLIPVERSRNGGRQVGLACLLLDQSMGWHCGGLVATGVWVVRGFCEFIRGLTHLLLLHFVSPHLPSDKDWFY